MTAASPDFAAAVDALLDADRNGHPANLTANQAHAVLAVLGNAEDALSRIGKAAIVVKPTLSKPYSDAPDKTPWSQFMRLPATRAYNLGVDLRRALRAARLGSAMKP